MAVRLQLLLDPSFLSINSTVVCCVAAPHRYRMLLLVLFPLLTSASSNYPFIDLDHVTKITALAPLTCDCSSWGNRCDQRQGGCGCAGAAYCAVNGDCKNVGGHCPSGPTPPTPGPFSYIQFSTWDGGDACGETSRNTANKIGSMRTNYCAQINSTYSQNVICTKGRCKYPDHCGSCTYEYFASPNCDKSSTVSRIIVPTTGLCVGTQKYHVATKTYDAMEYGIYKQAEPPMQALGIPAPAIQEWIGSSCEGGAFGYTSVASCRSDAQFSFQTQCQRTSIKQPNQVYSCSWSNSSTCNLRPNGRIVPGTGGNCEKMKYWNDCKIVSTFKATQYMC